MLAGGRHRAHRHRQLRDRPAVHHHRAARPGHRRRRGARAEAKSLHSGMWGGPVPDPVSGLCEDVGRPRQGRRDHRHPRHPGQGEAAHRRRAEEYRTRCRATRPFRKQAGLLRRRAAARRPPPVGDQLAAAVAGGQRDPGQSPQGRAQHHQRERLGPRRHPHRPRHRPARRADEADRGAQEGVPWGVEVQDARRPGRGLVVHRLLRTRRSRRRSARSRRATGRRR